MPEWSERNILNFINQYKEKRLLWDAKHPRHFNKIHRHDAWIDLAQRTGRTAEECKRKMTNLLAAMRREKSKMKKSVRSGKGPDEVYKSTWFAFKSMQFLWEKDKPIETANSIHMETAEHSEPEQEPEPTISQAVKAQPDLLTTHTDTTESSPISSQSGPKKRKVLDRCLDTAFEILSSCAPTHDEAQDFGNFTAKKLRKYNTITRSAVQHAIMGIFFNADMGLFQKQSLLAQSGPNNPYGLHSVAQSLYPGVNMPSVAHLSRPPPPLDTPSTSSTPQPTGSLQMDTNSTSSTPQPTAPQPSVNPSTSSTPEHTRSRSTSSAPQLPEQNVVSPTPSDGGISSEELI